LGCACRKCSSARLVVACHSGALAPSQKLPQQRAPAHASIDDLYDYARTPARPGRRRTERVSVTWAVTDHWPKDVPVTDAEGARDRAEVRPRPEPTAGALDRAGPSITPRRSKPSPARPAGASEPSRAVIAATTCAHSLSASRSTRKKCASWGRQACSCARLFKRKNGRFWSAQFFYRNGAPDTIRTCDLRLRANGHAMPSIEEWCSQPIERRSVACAGNLSMRCGQFGDKSRIDGGFWRQFELRLSELGCPPIRKQRFANSGSRDVALHATLAHDFLRGFATILFAAWYRGVAVRYLCRFPSSWRDLSRPSTPSLT
jgi:hypothetical protein